jgi:hypothetical protein
MLPTALAVGKRKRAGSSSKAGSGKAGSDRAGLAATAALSATGGRGGVRTSSRGNSDKVLNMFVNQNKAQK